MEQGRRDLCCCVKDEEVGEQVNAWKRSRTQGRGEDEEADYEVQIDAAAHVQHQHPDGSAHAASSAPSQSSPSGSASPPLPPFSSTSPFSSESYLQRFMRRYYLPFLFHPLVRLLVLLLFPLAFCWLLYYGLTHLQLGLDQSTVVPDDSYLKAYFASEAAFLNVGPPVFFVVRQPDPASASCSSLSYNYSSLSFQDRICSNSASCDDQSLQNLILAAACTPGSFIAQSATSWLDTYMVWLSTPDCCSFDPAAPGVLLPIGSADTCFDPSDPSCPQACFNNSATTSALYDRPDAAAFEQWMQPWLVNSTCGEECAYCSAGLFDSIAFTTSPLPNSSCPLEQTTVTVSRYLSFHTPLRQQSDYIGAIASGHALASRMAEEQQLDVFPYSIIYVYFQQFLDIEQVAVRLFTAADVTQHSRLLLRDAAARAGRWDALSAADFV
jgi:Niemann-Pick C1 protein